MRWWWSRLSSSLWFVPGVIVFAAVALAVLLIDASIPLGGRPAAEWPRVFGAGADGSRGMLTAVATSMITVAGVVFSITIVTLSLAASQYSSRVLRNFMNDRANQAVLGVFVGIFAYCLIVLRTIRGGDEGQFVPALAVLGAVVLAFVGIGFLVYFIHHIATAIQASHILATVSADTLRTVDRMLPEPFAGDGSGPDPARAPASGRTVRADKSGYVQTVDEEGLLRLASEEGVTIRMARGVGDFVIEDGPLLALDGDGEPDETLADRTRGLVGIGRQRTMDQDVGFGIRQIVDVALKALSPGINDTTTAVMCLDYLTAILSRISGRQIPPRSRVEGGTLRLTLCPLSYAQMVDEGFDQIRHHGEGNVAIAARLLWALETLTALVPNGERREVIHRQAGALLESITRAIIPDGERRALEARAAALFARSAGTTAV
ncbi:MAG: DUF2254 domain-containing protein [Gemmatimonadales bacterium]